MTEETRTNDAAQTQRMSAFNRAAKKESDAGFKFAGYFVEARDRAGQETGHLNAVFINAANKPVVMSEEVMVDRKNHLESRGVQADQIDRALTTLKGGVPTSMIRNVVGH